MSSTRGSEPRGRAGEEYAAAIMQGTGYTVLARNFHSRWGEVDIIARKGSIIAFVEVKTRRWAAMVTGAEAVGKTKRRKILRTALLFLQRHPQYDLQPRFDVFTIETDGHGNILSHDILEGAFDGEEYDGQAGV